MRRFITNVKFKAITFSHYQYSTIIINGNIVHHYQYITIFVNVIGPFLYHASQLEGRLLSDAPRRVKRRYKYFNNVDENILKNFTSLLRHVFK